jgi:hypothetical protein
LVGIIHRPRLEIGPPAASPVGADPAVDPCRAVSEPRVGFGRGVKAAPLDPAGDPLGEA